LTAAIAAAPWYEWAMAEASSPAEPWSTVHAATYGGYVLRLATAEAERFDPRDALGQRLRLVLAEGAGGLLVRGDRAFPFHGPAAFCLDEREVVSFQGEGLRFRLLYFHPAILHPELGFEAIRPPGAAALPTALSQDLYWLEPFFARAPGGVFQPGPLAWDRIRSLWDRVEEERTACRDAGWPCRTRSHLITLLIFLRGLDRVDLDPMAVAQPDERIRELLVYLQAHYDHHLTVAELAHRFGSNRTSLQARFAAATGRTIMEYVTALRIEVAQGLLRDTLVPMNEVGERIGYADPAAFSRAFKKAVGAAPSEYRERTNWMLRVG
jgi:AraC family L-rhamnose operon regulatory protein RhaS